MQVGRRRDVAAEKGDVVGPREARRARGDVDGGASVAQARQDRRRRRGVRADGRVEHAVEPRHERGERDAVGVLRGGDGRELPRDGFHSDGRVPAEGAPQQRVPRVAARRGVDEGRRRRAGPRVAEGPRGGRCREARRIRKPGQVRRVVFGPPRPRRPLRGRVQRLDGVVRRRGGLVRGLGRLSRRRPGRDGQPPQRREPRSVLRAVEARARARGLGRGGVGVAFGVSAAEDAAEPVVRLLRRARGRAVA